MIGAGFMSLGAGILSTPAISTGGGSVAVVNKYSDGVSTTVHLNTATSVNASGSNCIVVLAVLNTAYANTPNFVASFNGTSMTRIGYSLTSADVSCVMWYLTSPSQVTATLTVGGSFLACNTAAIFIYCLSGANSSPIDASSFVTATSSPTTSYTTTSANTFNIAAYGDYYTNGGTVIRPTSPWADDLSFNSGLADGQGFSSTRTVGTAGSVTANATAAYNAMAMCMVAIKP